MTLWRVRATVDDRPGFLSVLTASLALRSINILSVQVHGTEAGVVDDFLVDAPNELTEAELLAAIVRGRGREPWIRRTEARYLVDPPTDALAAAAHLVRTPDDLPEVLSTALLNASVRSVTYTGAANGFTANRMQIAAPDGGTLLVERAAPPFTPAEFARACAFVEIVAEVLATSGVRWHITLADGSSVHIRPSTSQDAPDITALQARSAGTFPGVARRADRNQVVAIGSDGEIVGVGTLRLDGVEAEAALLVDVGWRRRGVGTGLLRRLVEMAEELPVGVDALHVHGYAGDDALTRTMGRLELPQRRTIDGDVMTVTADLRTVHPGADSIVGALPRPVGTIRPVVGDGLAA